jgi:3-methyladenine DNA glycosylase AlkD
MQYEDIIKELKSLANPKAVEGMAKYGITPKRAYGVLILNLRELAKRIEEIISLLKNSGRQIPVRQKS